MKRKILEIKDPEKSVDSILTSRSSEKHLNTIEINKKSTHSLIKRESASTETSLNSQPINLNIHTLEDEIQHKLNNLMKIKKRLSTYTLRLNNLSSAKDLDSPTKLSYFPSSNMSVVNKNPEIKVNHF